MHVSDVEREKSGGAGSGLPDAPRGRSPVIRWGVAALTLVVLVLLASLTPLPQERFWRDAFFRYPLETMAGWMEPRLPAEVKERINP